MRLLRALLSVLLLPGTVAVLIPALLLVDAALAPWPLAALGALLLAAGVGMIAWTVALFFGRSGGARSRHGGTARSGWSSAAPTGTSATR